MSGYIVNIEAQTEANAYFREVLFTAPHCQLVVMSLNVGEDIGEEVHTLDQFLRVESGEGKAILDGEETPLKAGFAVVVPAGTKHNIVNTSSSVPLKLYTLYAPAQHRDGTIHKTKAEAMADEEDHT
jgi:mannose-6-phosphate isomerase-like protein (cupin superfamily)